MAGFLVFFVLVLLVAAFIGGGWVVYRLEQPVSTATEAAARSGELYAQVEALKATHLIDEASWQAERAMLREALRLDDPEDRS